MIKMSFCADGMKMQVRMKSFASRAQLAVTQAEIDAAMELEWDRRLITVLGSANNRLYEFRLQTANSTFETSKVRQACAAHICVCCTYMISCLLWLCRNHYWQWQDPSLALPLMPRTKIVQLALCPEQCGWVE